MWKFKSWKGKDKACFLLSVGAILCILAFPAEKLMKKADGGASQVSASPQLPLVALHFHFTSPP